MTTAFALPSALADLLAFSGTAPEQPELGAASDSWMLRHLPNEVYHSDRDALSCSLLKPLLISPAHFLTGLVACESSSAARDFGSLVHLLVLQPHLVSRELVVYPGVPETKGVFDAFAALHPDRLAVDEPTFAKAGHLAERVMETLYKGRPLQRFIEESIPEASIYFTEPTTGLRMRIRLDAMHPDISLDLKSTRFPLARAFMRDAVDKHYDMQSYMYTLGRCLFEGTTTPKPFVLVAAENVEPFSVSIYPAGETFMSNGAAKFQACAAAFKACTDSGYWPNLSGETVLEIEPWQQFTGKPAWQAALGSTGA